MCHRLISTIAFNILAFIFLGSMLIVHYYFSPSLLFILILLLSAATIYQSVGYLKENFKLNRIPIEAEALKTLLTVIVSAFLTFALSDFWGISNVLASSLVGLLAGVFLKKYDLAAFTGSFVGMSSIHLFDYSHLLMASFIGGIVFIFGKSVFPGVGGKLGSTAFLGTLLTSAFIHKNAFSFLEYGIDLWHVDFSFTFVIVLIIISSAASYMTFFITQKFCKGSAVIASSIVGIAGSLLTPLFFKESAFLMSTAIFCASFAGMSKTNVLKSSAYYWVSGALTGFIFFTTTPIFIGLGGKLGTSAFLATLGSKSIQDLSQNIKRRLQND